MGFSLNCLLSSCFLPAYCEKQQGSDLYRLVQSKVKCRGGAKSALLTWSGMQIRPPVFGDEWIRGWKGVQLLPDLQTVILCVSACVLVSSPGMGGALQGRWDWLGCQFWTLAQLQSRLGRPSHRCHFGSHLCLQKIRIEQVQVKHGNCLKAFQGFFLSALCGQSTPVGQR